MARHREVLTKLDQQLDQARQGARPEEIRALEARVEEARAGLNRAEQQVAYGQVTSPIDGYILRRDIEPGQMLSPGMPMFTIGSREKLVVEAEVPEEHLWALQVGQQVRISGDGLRGRECQGRILRVAPAAKENLLKRCLVFGMWLGKDLPALVLVILATCVAATGLGMLLVALCRTRSQVTGISVLIVLAMSSLGGSWWPLYIVPEWMQRVAHITLTAWAMDGFNALLTYGGGIFDVIIPVTVLLGMGAVFFAVALSWFKLE